MLTQENRPLLEPLLALSCLILSGKEVGRQLGAGIICDTLLAC